MAAIRDKGFDGLMDNNNAMRCCVDDVIKRYLYTTINNIQIEKEDIQKLLDGCRKALDLDAIYVLEGLPTNSGFEITMESIDDGCISLLGHTENGGEVDYKRARGMYDEDFLKRYTTTLGERKGAALSYGLFHEGDYDGSVCMIDFKNPSKEWSEDEIRAVKKLGRALHRQIMTQRLKKIDKERAKQHEEMVRTLKEAEEASKAKSFFLFNMSHDIRTPMNAIIGFTAMAKKNLDDKRIATEYLNKLDASSRYMLRILNDVLDMAKIDSGKMELDLQTMDMVELCSKAEDVFRDVMKRRELEFSIQSDIKDRKIVCDVHRLEQVIINLLSNASKYTKPGGMVCLNCQQIPCDREGYARFSVSVKDTGIGISKAFQKHLFEEFERERTARKSGIQGTGLGLAIAKKIADMLDGGSLVCNSELGKGTEFVFSFEAKISTVVEEQEAFGEQKNTFVGMRVLLVEDNNLNREIAVDMLSDIGFLCEEATDGAIAVEMVRNSQPGYYDVILMDIQMPYMDGYQATREIRMLENKELANIPIVAMTANAFDEDRRKALKAQMNAHLPKPAEMDDVIKTLKKVLNVE